ncbi:MAG: hypothetical protein ABI183_18390 [Polyangiaceae bacterium]
MASFDLQKTNDVMALLATARETRDDAWRQAFLAAIVDASMASKSEQVVRGPDGFPYFVLVRPPVAESFTPFCVSHILGHCTSSGIGIVVEPTERAADWVFSYGDLFSLRAYGTFAGDPVDREVETGPKTEVLEAERQIMIGSPSEEFLPTWARRVIAGFLKSAAKIETPSVCVMADPRRGPSRNLVFNIHPQDFASQEDFQRVMNMISWFLPAKRACVALSRGALSPSDFIPL